MSTGPSRSIDLDPGKAAAHLNQGITCLTRRRPKRRSRTSTRSSASGPAMPWST